MTRSYTLSTARQLVEGFRERIDRHSLNVLDFGTPIEGSGNVLLYAQPYTPDEQGEDYFNDVKFIFWSTGIKFATDIADIDATKTHYLLFDDDRAYMMRAPIEVPSRIETEMPEEYGEISDDVKLKTSEFKGEELHEAPSRSIHDLPQAAGGGARTEYHIAADVLKKRLLLKDMDETMKWAIFNSKSPKANIQAINFVLQSSSRNYTHSAFHLMHAIRDLYRSIERQT